MYTSKKLTLLQYILGAVLMYIAMFTQVLARDTSQIPSDAAAGAQAWAQVCGRCHNLRAPTDFRDDEWEPIITHMRIRAGLTGQEARDILVFLQTANSPSLPAAMSQKTVTTAESRIDGKDIYEKTCQACHGDNGRGAIPGVPDFTLTSGVLSKSDDVLLKNIREGYQSPGSTMAMPAKGGNPSLVESDLKSVIVYIRSRFGR